MDTSSLTRVVVSVESLDAALVFYAELLGLPVATRAPEMASLVAGGGAELLLHQRPTSPSEAAVATCFTIDDLEGTVNRWQLQSGEVIDAPEEQPWGERMAVVKDPDGHVVCLIQAR